MKKVHKKKAVTCLIRQDVADGIRCLMQQYTQETGCYHSTARFVADAATRAYKRAARKHHAH